MESYIGIPVSTAIGGLGALAVIVTVIVQVLKNILPKKIPTQLLTIIISLIISLAFVCVFLNVTISTIILGILMGFITAFVSMSGFDALRSIWNYFKTGQQKLLEETEDQNSETNVTEDSETK